MSGPINTPTSGLEAARRVATVDNSIGSGVATWIGPLEPSMLVSLPLQVDVEGGSTPVVLAAVVTFFVATVLAVLVTYRFVEGYRRTRARPILLLAVGMFLLAPAPMFVRLLAGNLEAVPLAAQLLLTTLSELCGLLVILYVVYTT
ncbi:DUF7521 family protein [Natronorubrum texcoconense]|uniref:Uncharacterized protein n=1 Tax=Natronorubrum texcoconense TaxID=1095776 RepID=A0A1G9BYL3_9EURY|nr:hypothetical protein [Natronorubrum texcoconense]SDK44483.1 hypothetical protein SAMN04515672_3136 [Natronorubrum texcoconense]